MWLAMRASSRYKNSRILKKVKNIHICKNIHKFTFVVDDCAGELQVQNLEWQCPSMLTREHCVISHQ
jgi:hypothetical protein